MKNTRKQYFIASLPMVNASKPKSPLPIEHMRRYNPVLLT
jgi:hypothetical protein